MQSERLRAPVQGSMTEPTLERDTATIQDMLARAHRIAGAYDDALVDDGEKTISIPDMVRPGELFDLLDHVTGHAEILSLDCFDTLLWRRVEGPLAAFRAAESSPAFQRAGFSAQQRIRAEEQARRLAMLKHGRTEVSLEEIYRCCSSSLSDADVSELARAELEAENASCFAYPPMVDLLYSAHDRGMKVIVASDTYLGEGELRWLLQQQLPKNAYLAIDRVYCSSDFCKSKAGGMFSDIVGELKVKPESILHLGDNRESDCTGARAQGVAGIHFMPFNPTVNEQMRLTASAGHMMLAEEASTSGALRLYQGVVSGSAHKEEASYDVGYFGLGPILCGFADHIQTTLQELRIEGKRPKIAFISTEARLAHAAFLNVAPGESAALIHVSRFSARACSFRSSEDVDDFLAHAGGPLDLVRLAEQLLLSEATTSAIVQRVGRSSQPFAEFAREVCSGATLDEIVSASAAYRLGMYKHLDRELDLRRGETLLLVGLGFEGAVQRSLMTGLSEDKGVELRGCYLMAAPDVDGTAGRTGVIDDSWCEQGVFATIGPYFGLLRELCGDGMGRVVSYTDQGDPLYDGSRVSMSELSRVAEMQGECCEFVRQAGEFFARSGRPPASQEYRVASLVAAARLLYLPTEREAEFLEGFRMDVPIGGVHSARRHEQAANLDGLRRRGLFFMEGNTDKLGALYPSELRSCGIELSMMLFAQHRYGLNFSQGDLNQRRIPIHVLALRGDNASGTELQATATHDGCFSLDISVGACEYSVGVLLGRAFKWVQLYSVDLIRTEELYGAQESRGMHQVLDELQCEGATDCGDGLLNFKDSDGFVFLNPVQHSRSDATFVYRIVFRPLVDRPTEESKAFAVPD